MESPPVYEKEVIFFSDELPVFVLRSGPAGRVGCYVVGILVGQVGWIFVRYPVLEPGSA